MTVSHNPLSTTETMATLSQFPIELVNKILISRPTHPMAKLIGDSWPLYEQAVYNRCDQGLYDSNWLMTVKAYAVRHRKFGISWDTVSQDIKKVSIRHPERLLRIQAAVRSEDWDQYFECFTIGELACLGW